MKNLSRASRNTSSNARARAQLAEFGIAVRLAQSPTVLASIVERLDVNRLSDRAFELIELVSDYPVLCSEVGPAAVGDMLGMDDDLVRLFAWYELAPADEFPALEECLEITSPLAPLEKLGALEQWRKEIRHGADGQRADVPSTWRLDALFRAAAYEASAIDLERQGLHAAAIEEMRTAAEILLKDAEERKRAA